VGFDAASAVWHSLGERGDLAVNAPVGTLLIVILDHLVLGCGWGREEWKGMGREEWEGMGRELVRAVLMWGAANWSVCGVAAGPPVMTKLPLAVHLTATSWTCGGVMAVSSLLRAEHSISSLIWPSLPILSFATSTNRLGLGGLALVIAKKVHGGVLMGADNFCLPLLVLVSLLERGEPFSRHQLLWTTAGESPRSSEAPDWGKCRQWVEQGHCSCQ